MSTNEIWKLKDVMAYTGQGYRGAKRILDMEGCPILPRGKGGEYRVPSAAFKEWYDNAAWLA